MIVEFALQSGCTILVNNIVLPILKDFCWLFKLFHSFTDPFVSYLDPAADPGSMDSILCGHWGAVLVGQARQFQTASHVRYERDDRGDQREGRQIWGERQQNYRVQVTGPYTCYMFGKVWNAHILMQPS